MIQATTRILLNKVYFLIFVSKWVQILAQCPEAGKIGEQCDIFDLCYQNTEDTANISLKTCICTDCGTNKTISSLCEYKIIQKAYVQKLDDEANIATDENEILATTGLDNKCKPGFISTENNDCIKDPCVTAKEESKFPCLDINSCKVARNRTDFICTSCPHGKFGGKCELSNYCVVGDEDHEKITCVNGVCSTCLKPIPTFTKHIIDFHCRCAFGYTGPTCKVPDPCMFTDIDDPPCKNGGKCTSLKIPPYHKCTCKQGFSGNKCQLRDPCFFEGKNQCPPDKECKRKNDAEYICRDKNLCNLDPKTALNSGGKKYPCENNGSCSIDKGDGIVTGYSYKCNCSATKFGGPNCQYLKGDFVTLFPATVDVGVEYEYFVYLLYPGYKLLVFVVMDDGFSMAVSINNFRRVSDTVDARDSDGNLIGQL